VPVETHSVELHEAIRRRAMVRSFSAEPLGRDEVDLILEAPCAPHGSTPRDAWVVLEDRSDSPLFRRHDDAAWRTRNEQWSEGLARAPVVLHRLQLTELRRPLRRGRQGWRRGSARRPPRGPSPTGSATRLRCHDGPVGCRGCRARRCVLGPSGAKPNWRPGSTSRRAGPLLRRAAGPPDGGTHRSSSLDRDNPEPSGRITGAVGVIA